MLGILEHGCEALGGIGGIEGNVGSSGFEDGEHPHDHLEGALGMQSDEGIGF